MPPLHWSPAMCTALSISTVLFILLSIAELVQWQIPCLYQTPNNTLCNSQCCLQSCGSQPPNCVAFNNQPYNLILLVSWVWVGVVTVVMLGVYLTCYLRNRKVEEEEKRNMQGEKKKKEGTMVNQVTPRTQEQREIEMTDRGMPNAALIQYGYQPYQGMNYMNVKLIPAKKGRSYRQY